MVVMVIINSILFYRLIKSDILRSADPDPEPSKPHQNGNVVHSNGVNGVNGVTWDANSNSKLAVQALHNSVANGIKTKIH